MNKNEKEKHKIKNISLDRAGLRSFMGNPEEFKLSFYGIFIACIPIFIFIAVVWFNWN
ncbi:hypothetical protein MZM54_03140 [[Brevibacterium] frigoritolerans]|nr:hypothetical protein [Peribacillus frigoritolerans]